MSIIIYGSQYGTAKRYAEELARRTGFEIREYSNTGDISGFETIVYVGALYASGVLGMKKTFDRLTDPSGKRIFIATVGVTDPTDKEYTDTVKGGMSKQLKQEVFDNARIYHLRGGIDYSKLSFKHKTLMGMLCKQAKKLPEEQRTADVRAMLETQNKTVDFVDFSSLDQIVQDIQFA